MNASQRIRIEGHVSAGFEAVRDAFAENFSRRHELGGACCVYHRGEKVVDLWGGVPTPETTRHVSCYIFSQDLIGDRFIFGSIWGQR